ncbi:MAG: hypothetical protein MI921_24930 [Cytophagales bacterium]|nr:hypothetical protein [Cytophagales bacterium]
MQERIIKKSGQYIVDVNVITFQGENEIVAYSPALQISSYGETKQDAEHALGENIAIFMDYATSKNTLIEDLLNLGWTIKKKPDFLFIPPPYSTEDIVVDIATDTYEMFEHHFAIPA